jgi:uncharacterized RDD family membrane protein YckC
MEWFYAEGDRQLGPVSDPDFQSLVQNGVVTDQTLVWHAGLPEWRPYGQVRAREATVAPGGGAVPVLPAGTDPTRQAPCAECGGIFPETEMVSYKGANICGGCKPAFFQKVREGGVTMSFAYAGFWIRFVAYFIDAILMTVVNFAVGFVIGFTLGDPAVAEMIGSGIGLLLNLAYYVFFHGKYGATLGKMALGLRVVMPDGSPISYMRAFGRFFAEILSGLILLIGYIIAAFDVEKRALHDHICNTRVIRT